MSEAVNANLRLEPKAVSERGRNVFVPAKLEGNHQGSVLLAFEPNLVVLVTVCISISFTLHTACILASTLFSHLATCTSHFLSFSKLSLAQVIISLTAGYFSKNLVFPAPEVAFVEEPEGVVSREPAFTAETKASEGRNGGSKARSCFQI
ncbi:hypothetical protein KCU92_g277, partial [Aureobasidium melanogenum]